MGALKKVSAGFPALQLNRSVVKALKKPKPSVFRQVKARADDVKWKTEVMRRGIALKFDPKKNPELVRRLLATGDKQLCEVPDRKGRANMWTYSWAEEGYSKKKNLPEEIGVLGQLLMERRTELQQDGEEKGKKVVSLKRPCEEGGEGVV